MARERKWQNSLGWYEKLMDPIEQQEDDLRYEDEQRASAVQAASAAARRAASAQATSPQTADSPADPAREAALDRARKVVGVLAAQSGEHPGVAWAAGVCRVAGQTAVVATSNEGLGYIPAGVLWDRTVRLVFDPAAPIDEAMSWQGLADPARIVAGRFLRMSEPRRDVELLALASTGPVGGQVADFLAQHGALTAERAAPVWDFDPRSAVHRVDVVLPGTLDVIRQMAWWRRWDTAVALLRDATAWADLPRTNPQLHEIARGLAFGQAGWDRVAFVEQGAQELPKRYQLRRVPEQRLGPVAAGRQDASTLLPSGGASAYVVPFYAARVCAMLSIMLRARTADETLSAESLADVAYEHYCVAENPDVTRGILGQGLAGQQQEQGGSQ